MESMAPKPTGKVEVSLNLNLKCRYMSPSPWEVNRPFSS